jgi:hypothetical protein
MLRILAALVGSLLLTLLLTFGERIEQPLARLVRSLLLAVVAALVLVGLVIGTAGALNEAWWAAAIGAVIVLIAARMAWKVHRRQREQGAAMQRGPTVPSTNLVPDLRWRKLDGVLSWSDRQRSRLAREHIRGFLAERQSPSLTPEHQSLLVSLDRRVPELIDTCLDRCQRARPDERRAYVASTLEKLARIGDEAERARQEVRAADDTRLQVLHRYFDGVAPAEPDRTEPR